MGVGKIIVINFFVCFYEFDEGRILIDGIDIKIFIRVSLRKNMGFVF